MANTHFSGPVWSLNGFGTGTETAPSIVATSATPGTARGLVGDYTTFTTMTSGNLVGVRGNITVGGTVSGTSFLYGTQGKVTSGANTIAASSNVYGLVGQFDFSSAVAITGGTLAPIWADWGASSTALTGSAYGSLIRAQNTTAITLNAMMYLYGKASSVMDIDSNGSACVDATAHGSTAAGRLKISVNGATAYLHVFAD
jgi:hypothetical protein